MSCRSSASRTRIHKVWDLFLGWTDGNRNRRPWPISWSLWCRRSSAGVGKTLRNLSVTRWDEHAKTIIGGGKGVQEGYLSVSDPRVINREKGDHYLTGGHYGVVPWTSSTGAVSGFASHDNGRWSVADPRMPDAIDNLVAITSVTVTSN
jgi:hypothetical protein